MSLYPTEYSIHLPWPKMIFAVVDQNQKHHVLNLDFESYEQ